VQRLKARVTSLTRVPPRAWAIGAVALVLTGLLPVPDAIGWPALVLGATAACAIPIAGASRRGRVDVLELGVAVALVYFALFPLRAIVLLLDLDPFANEGALVAPSEIRRLALGTAALGLVAGGLAYNSRAGERLGSRLRVPRVRTFETAPVWMAIALFGVGLSALALVLLGNQGVAGLATLTSSGVGASAVSATTVYLVVGLVLLTRRAALGRRRDRVLLAVAVAVVAVVALGGQFKEPIIVALLTVAVTYRFTRRDVGLRNVVIAGLAVVLLVFPAVQAARLASTRLATQNPVTLAKALPGQIANYSIQGGTPREIRPWTPVTEPLVGFSSRLYSYDSMTLAVWYTPAAMPHQDGRTLALVGAGLVPRALWPEKPPVGLGFWFAKHYWNTPLGVQEVPQAIGHPAELWIDFGFLGVIAGLALLGLGYRLAVAAIRPGSTATAAVVYTVVFVTVVSVDRDLPLVYVSLGQRLAALAALIVPLLLLERMMDARRRQGIRGRHG
jgi:hypothetical protein